MNENQAGIVEIRSSRGRRVLRFHGRDGDYFNVTVEGDGPQGSARIWGYSDCRLLVDLFDSIAADWTGWSGERVWESIEHDLRIAIASRSTGQITIRVTMRHFIDDDDWRIECIILSEAGQLDGIARQVRKFFC